MKQKLLLKTILLLCALVVGSGNVWADTSTSTLTFTAACGGSGTADDAVVWGVTSDASESTYDGTKGIHYGTGKAEVSYLNLTTSGISGTITQIVVNASGASGTSAKLNVTVGGNAFGSEQSLTSSAANYTLTGSASGAIVVAITQSSAKKALYVKSITVTYTASSVANPTFSVAAGAYSSAQSVTLSTTTGGASIYYTMGDDPADPTSSSTPYTGAINVVATTTIKAIAIKDAESSAVSSATYTIISLGHAGTEADPYSVADARKVIDNSLPATGVYVAGIVYEGGSSLNNGALNYWISDDGTETDKFEIYKGKGISSAAFASTDDIQVGDEVVVYGDIMKYSSTYEFSEGSTLISHNRPVVPLIVPTASLADFSYVKGSGPSAAQSFTVYGSNLTANIVLTPPTGYEISLTEGSGYTSSLELTPDAGAVTETTIYVRLQSGLSANDYNGDITLTSTGATDKTVALTGAVALPSFSWDLSTDNTVTATETAMTWASAYASMAAAKGKSTTATNNYYPGSGQSITSTRFYSNSTLTIAPCLGYTIGSVVFAATTNGYASALQGSTWTNATAAVSGTTVTVTPTDGSTAISATIGATCGFTAITVYYDEAPSASFTIATACTDGAKYYGTFSMPRAFVVPAGLTVSEIGIVEGRKLNVSDYAEGAVVPANTGVMVSSTTAGEKTVTLSNEAGTSVLGASNMLKPSGNAAITASDMTTACGSDNKFYRLTMHKGTTIGFWWGAESGAAFSLAANKAYLFVPNSVSASEFMWFDNEDSQTTAIEKVESSKANGEYYNLNGQRIAQPTKGLYILNGKKVLVK